MTTATPEERIAALRMLRNEQMIGDSTPRARNRFSQRLSRTFGSRPQSGAGTPRRNSGIIAAAEPSPTAEAHPTSEMEATAEEPSTAEEALAPRLIPTAEVPPAIETSQVQEAHVAKAPHAAGSAHTIEVSRLSAERGRSQENSPMTDTHSNAKGKKTTGSPSEAEETPVMASTAAEVSDDQVMDPELARSANPVSMASTSPAPGSPSRPDIAPFYSYK